MLQGHLDTATSSGYVEGWAFDSENLLRAVSVAVVASGQVMASGLANRYRWDLADAGCGTGWCAFRLKLSRISTSLAEERVFLYETISRTELCSVSGLGTIEVNETFPTQLEHVLDTDPTRVYSIEELRGCSGVLASFFEAFGAEAYVRAAYIYILGRAADAAAISSYGGQLREGSLSPYELLKILYQSEEFQAGSRMITAPPDPGFAFQLP